MYRLFIARNFNSINIMKSHMCTTNDPAICSYVYDIIHIKVVKGYYGLADIL